MNLVTRRQWGARPAKKINRGNLAQASTGHWNGPSVPNVDHSRCASLVRGIQNFHMDGKGWHDIAYNFVICRHGYVFEGRGLNVINGANGTNEGNKTSHAIMWLSGEGDPFTPESKTAFKQCVKYVDDLTLAPNRAIGHRDHKSTECPGDVRYDWIKKGMPVSSGVPTPVLSPVYGLPVLREGDEGDHVTVLQYVLRHKASQNIKVDGKFGPATTEAVKNIQRVFKLTPRPDGVVGPKTWGAIKFLNSRH